MKNRARPKREGIVLLAVVAAIALISFVAYAFAESMIGETLATSEHTRHSQVQWAAQSGLEYVAWTLENQDPKTPQNLSHNPRLFSSVELAGDNPAKVVTTFSVVHPNRTMDNKHVRYGLQDESAKLNVNSLSLKPQDADESRARLLAIPHMTPQLADAILDYIDPDEEPRPLGAESAFYQTQTPSAGALNGPLHSLAQLLRVRGVTAKLLYGEDANGNGWLEPNEDDRFESHPNDDADGLLQAGWSDYLTVHSRESNTRRDGSAKININQKSLATLYDQLEREFGPTISRFVVAYRMEGSIQREHEVTIDFEIPTEAEREAAMCRRARRQLGLVDDAELFAEQVTRGELELRPAAYNIRSLTDLFGVSTLIEIDGEDQIVDSPWGIHPAAIEANMLLLDETLCLQEGNYVEGRINPREAPLQVMQSIPGVTHNIAKSIVAKRNASNRLGAATHRYHTIAWLIKDNVVDVVTLRRIAPYITGHGDVYRAHITAKHPGSTRTMRVSAIFDALWPRVSMHSIRYSGPYFVPQAE